MDPLIEKFARECGAWNQVYGNRMFMIDEHFDIEKFAELIVRECAQVADQWVDDEDNGHNLVSAKLKKHFGVEE